MAAILAVGASALDLGILSVALTLPGVLIAWLAGGWVDRHRRKPLLIGADLVRAVALLTIPAAAMTGHLSLALLYTVAAIAGVFSVLFTVADHVLITDLVASKRLLDANGKREAADAVAEITGPALGGALAETIGMRPTLWVLPAGGAVAALWLIAARRVLADASSH